MAVLDRDQLLRPVEPHADHHERAEAAVFTIHNFRSDLERDTSEALEDTDDAIDVIAEPPA